jgi:predicted nucleic acid-binding protein
MVYLDTSVLLAFLRAEDAAPDEALWREPLVSSRLVEYETLIRLNAGNHRERHGDSARALLARIAMLELVQPVVARASEPFPFALRTLDALHLASMLFLIDQGVPLELASYDRRLVSAAEQVGIPAYPL